MALVLNVRFNRMNQVFKSSTKTETGKTGVYRLPWLPEKKHTQGRTRGDSADIGNFRITESYPPPSWGRGVRHAVSADRRVSSLRWPVSQVGSFL